jgi:peptide/nickel transport system ATP-binding protein
MSLLEIEGLTVDIPTADGVARILDRIDMTMQPGDWQGIVGESGCGKSMTALAIMGLLPERARTLGRITFAGRDLLALDETTLCRVRGAEIGMIFQEPMTALNPVHTIGRQIAEGLRRTRGLGRADAELLTRRAMQRVGLDPARFSPDLYPHQLSGGQRQRVMIAMVLARRPKLLVADEPTTALDVTVQAEILKLVAEIADETGMALLLITHDLGVVAAIAEIVHIMYAGRIVETGPTDAVFAHLAHPYVRGLFEALPKEVIDPAARGASLTAIPGRVPDPLERSPACTFADRCAFADGRCRSERPRLVALHRPDHRTACFYPRPPVSG